MRRDVVRFDGWKLAAFIGRWTYFLVGSGLLMVIVVGPPGSWLRRGWDAFVGVGIVWSVVFGRR
jgi:hypothetical protein